MTQKQFQTARIVVVMALSIAIGVSVSLKISFVPPLAIILSAGLIQVLYRRVKEITADERDWKLAGQAALVTYRVTAMALVVIGGTLLACATANPDIYRAGYLLLYIVCFMMVVNIFAFLILGRRGDK